jgi:glycosyltransferase involved in cell wall biosynthesis
MAGTQELLVSVITVCFNSAEHIADSLRSVDIQTWPRIEHIIVDGASRDGTLEVVGKFCEPWRIVVSEPDRGIYDAMNKGVRQTHGDIIGFLNADDHYANENVLAHVSEAFADAGVDAVLGDVAFFRPDRPDRLVRRYRAHKFVPARLAWGWMPPHPALFVRRGVFERVGPFRTDFRIAGDYEWIVRAFGPTGIRRYTYMPETMVHMLTGGISTGGWRSTLLLNQEVLRACRANGLATSWPKLLLKYPAKALEFLRP